MIKNAFDLIKFIIKEIYNGIVESNIEIIGIIDMKLIDKNSISTRGNNHRKKYIYLLYFSNDVLNIHGVLQTDADTYRKIKIGDIRQLVILKNIRTNYVYVKRKSDYGKEFNKFFDKDKYKHLFVIENRVKFLFIVIFIISFIFIHILFFSQIVKGIHLNIRF